MSISGFHRTSSPGAARTLLDPSQRAVVSLPPTASAAVIGAPGSGKTTTLVELLADRVARAGWSPEHVLALSPTRATATRLRNTLARRLAVPTNGPLARTANSLAFEIATDAAARAGLPAPRLVTGGEQDNDFRQLLAGHIEDGTGPRWPAVLGPEVRSLRAFRTELRDLLMRATEYDIGTAELRELARSRSRQEWAAAADFFDEYVQVSGWVRPSHVDSPELIRVAVRAIESGDISDRVGALRLVAVDDLQEATESTISLLRALAGRGVAVVAFGDPDVATNVFRGGEPDSLGRLSTVLGRPARTLHLSAVHRQGAELRALTSAVTARIGAAAAGRQRAAASTQGTVGAAPAAETGPSLPAPPAPIVRIEAASPARQYAAIARALRERHLAGGVGWNDMAVVVRSGSQVPVIARALSLAEVPTRTVVGGAPLRDDLAARALLTVVDIGLRRSPLDAIVAGDLLLGPFGGLDRLALRRLKLALRAEELAGGGGRTADALLVDALAAPGRLATIDARVARQADRLAGTLAAVEKLGADGASIEDLLWLAWDRSGLAPLWREQALLDQGEPGASPRSGGGIAAAEANRSLDGILALFTAAKRFVERTPDAPASVFLDGVLDAEVPEDTLSPQSSSDAVLVATPQGVIGLEFDVVVVAGVQEGSWPNLRLRGSLLQAQELVATATSQPFETVDARKQVLGDELRMFALAVSRASAQLIVAAVANDDEAPSVFFSLLPPTAPTTDSSAEPPLSLRGLVGRLRRELGSATATGAERLAAASALARLAAEGVAGAHPDDWHGMLDRSTDAPLFAPDELVPVSPSQLDRVAESPLDWFLERIAGSKTSTAMGLGTIVHWAMETATDHSVDGLLTEIESRWEELAFESPWISEFQKKAARTLATGVAEYLADFASEGKQLVAAERRFELDVGRARLTGSIDRVERASDGAVAIIDLKTGTPITKSEVILEHPQLRAYQLAYSHGALDPFLDVLGDHHSGGAQLLFVKKGKDGRNYRVAEQPPLQDDDLENFRQRIQQAATLMSAATFVGVAEVTGWAAIASGGAQLNRVRAVSSD